MKTITLCARLRSRVGPTSWASFQIVGRFLNRVPFWPVLYNRCVEMLTTRYAENGGMLNIKNTESEKFFCKKRYSTCFDHRRRSSSRQVDLLPGSVYLKQPTSFASNLSISKVSISFYSRLSISRTRISRILRNSKRLSESKLHLDCLYKP